MYEEGRIEMNAVAHKCEKCKRVTKDPSGLCHYHRVSSPSQASSSRAFPVVKTGAILEKTEKSKGWLSEETGIDVSNFSSESSLSDMENAEQFAQWMKARVTVRAIESIYARKGSDDARNYAAKTDDTSLALIWARLDNSTMSEFFDNGMRDKFVSIVRSEVETRVDSGNFNPLNIQGYIDDFKTSSEPHGSATFF